MGNIALTPAEIESGLDRVKWAESLIKQLPEDHEGRNSWLLNYGSKSKPDVETFLNNFYDTGWQEREWRLPSVEAIRLIRDGETGRIKSTEVLKCV